MAPRGLSAEEKRIKLLEIFHESILKQLKELEKLGPKLKGIVSQSVKEVLQSVVDDGLVQADKIVFWSFPSQHGAMMKNRVKAADETRKDLQNQAKELRAEIETERATRSETAERTYALGQLASVKAELGELEKELSQYGACDPVQIEEKQRAVVLAQEAAVRWTDNVAILMTYFTRQNGVESSDIRQYLGIGDDFEDIC